jgi:hypothetical protein
MKKREHLGLGFFEWQIILWLSIWLAISQQALGLRPIREKPRSWSDEWLFGRKQEAEVGPFSAWNITGTYRGLPHALLHFFYVFYTSGLSTMLWVYVCSLMF